MKVLGRIKFFDVNRGFGFIVREDGVVGDDIYLDGREMRAAGIAALSAGDRIVFTTRDAGGGWTRATAIELLAPAPAALGVPTLG